MTVLEKFFVNHPLRVAMVSGQVERLLRHVPVEPSMKCLEVGCGTGGAAVRMARDHRLEVIGLDVDPDQIRVAKEAGSSCPKLEFVLHDATSLPFPDDWFDIVVSMKTTHHISDWPRALEEISRVLTPGGHFLYEDFTFPAWAARLGGRLFPGEGFPTFTGLRAVLAAPQWDSIYEAKTIFHYRGVFRLEHRAGGAAI